MIRQPFLLGLCFFIIWAFPLISLSAVPLLRIKSEIDPVKQSISARAEYSGLPDNSACLLYLNKSFTVTSVKVDGKETGFTFDASAASPPYVPIAKPVSTERAGKEFEVTYSGYIRDVISGVNMIAPELVELAIYSAWFPFNASIIPSFDYELELILPAGLTVVTGGTEEKITTENGKTMYRVRSINPCADVPFLASPLLRKLTGEKSGFQVEVFFSDKGRKLAEGKIDFMADAVVAYKNRFGEAPGTGKLRFVYSPREGWGYSRLPLIVLSEGRALHTSETRFGGEDDMKYGAHEIAHFWWSISDVNTNNDWINEGLAEYSAFAFASARFGEEYRQHCIKGYCADIRKAATKTSIIETSSASPDRYINWYEKTALLLHVVELRVGKDALNAFLSVLYRNFKGSRNATTSDFINLAGSMPSGAAYAFLKRFLAAPGWSEEDILELAVAAGLKNVP